MRILLPYRRQREQILSIIPQDFEMVRGYLATRGRENGFISSIHKADEMHSYLVREMGNSIDSAIVDYFETGRILWRVCKDTLVQAGRSLGSIDRILECACGYGRVTRHIIGTLSAEKITSLDIQRGAIEFQKEVMGTNAVCSHMDPSKIAIGGRFDLIVVVSLFTHLPLHRFEQWLTRLYELLAPDGLLLFSVHPQDLLEPSLKDPSGFTFQAQRAEKNEIASEDPETDLQEYGSTYVTEAAVREIARRCSVNSLYFSSRGLLEFQDFYAASRCPVPALESWQKSRMIRGFIDKVVETPNGELCVSGWCMDVARGERPMKLKVWLDGRILLGRALVSQPRPDVADVAQRPDWINSGWSLTAPMPRDREGRQLVNVEVDGMHFDTGFFEIVPK